MNPDFEKAQRMAMQQKQMQAQIQEQAKLKMFLDYIKRKFQGQAPQQNFQQNNQSSPAGGYISKDYTRNRLDQAGDY